MPGPLDQNFKDTWVSAATEDSDYQQILASSVLSCNDIVYGANISHIDKELINMFRYMVYQGVTERIDAMISVNPELSKDEVSTFIVYATGNQAVLKRFPEDSDDDNCRSEEAGFEDNFLELQNVKDWGAEHLTAMGPQSHLNQPQSVDADSTLGDGNCAFNAFAQGLVRLLRAGQTAWIATLFDYINSPNLSPSEREAITQGALVHLIVPEGADEIMTEAQQQAFCSALLSYSSAEQQRMLAPLLRHKAVSTMANPHMYQTMYRVGLEERLKLTYASYLYQQSLDAASGSNLDPAFIQAIQLLTGAYIEYDSEEDSALFLAWWHGEATGYQECLTYASSALNPERFHQWLTWLNTENIADYARHYTYAEPIEDAALLIHFPHIKQQLEMAPYQSETDFLEWWETAGKAAYFTNMLTPATNARDRHKWGSDDEISVLALDFGLNVGILKDNAMDTTVVGVAEAVILESSLLAAVGDAEVNRLIQLGLVEQITRFDKGLCANYVRFRQGALEKLAIFSMVTPADLNIELLITQYEAQSAVTPMSASEFLLQIQRPDLLSCFETRGVLNSATGNFITDQVQLADGSTIYPIDRARVHRCLLNLDTETVTYLQALLASISISFTICHHHDHWSCQTQARRIQPYPVVDGAAGSSSHSDYGVSSHTLWACNEEHKLDKATTKNDLGGSLKFTLFAYSSSDELDYSLFAVPDATDVDSWENENDHEEKSQPSETPGVEISQPIPELIDDSTLSKRSPSPDDNESGLKRHCVRR